MIDYADGNESIARRHTWRMTMPNSVTHSVIASAAIGGIVALREQQVGVQSARPAVAALLAASFANLPDRLEPAVHPHHRQFFHSLVAGVAIGYAGYQLYRWQPAEDWKKAARILLLIASAAYVCHLTADALTAKSIPLLGKIS